MNCSIKLLCSIVVYDVAFFEMIVFSRTVFELMYIKKFESTGTTISILDIKDYHRKTGVLKKNRSPQRQKFHVPVSRLKPSKHFVNIWALSSASRFNDRDKYVLPAARVAATFLMQTFTSGYRKIYYKNSCFKLFLVFLQLDRNAKNLRKLWMEKKRNPLIYLND